MAREEVRYYGVGNAHKDFEDPERDADESE
jgi:hypothetical protein